MTKPTLGVLSTPEPTPSRTASLLLRLTQWCKVQYASGSESLGAWFATGPRAQGLASVLESAAPIAIWVSDARDVDRVPDLSHVVAVGQDHELVEPFGVRGVLWPDGIDADRYLPVAPFVRERWRRRWGLPARLVWSPDEFASPPAADVNRTALALASAVAATGRTALEALAWGAPLVTDATTARAIGGVDGHEVLVAERQTLGRAAVRLADDSRVAATLSRAGRRLVERRHDTSRPPSVLASRLGLRADPADPIERMGAWLDDLWTPADAGIRLRVEGHTLAGAAR